MKSPIEILLTISDISKSIGIKRILKKYDLSYYTTLSGKGTAKSTIEDIFGFGIIDKTVFACIVPNECSELICNELDQIINKKIKSGIVLTIPISAITNDLFEIIMEGKNVNKQT